MWRFRGVVEVAKIVAIVFISAIIIRTFVFQPFVVEGSSMEPDFHNGEYLLIEKMSYHLKQPHRGDVVVFRYPRDPSVNYIKRIIGLPGETIRIEKNTVYINQKPLKENYLQPGELTQVDSNADAVYEVALGSSQYFVMGDNRQHSSDSREWGPLDRNYIIGRSALVLNPVSDFKAIASPNY